MKKKLVLYGAGNVGKLWLEKLGLGAVYAFADRNKNIIGTDIEGKRVISIEQLSGEEDVVIFPSVSAEKLTEIRNEIIRFGMGDKLISTPLENFGRVDPSAYCGSNVEYEGKHFLGEHSYIDNSKIGYASYISYNTIMQNVIIGRYTSIGPNVEIVFGQHPTHTFVSTHPAFYSVNHTIGLSYTNKQMFEEYRYASGKKSVIIGNDVWIGNSVKIMEGVSIADGTIVAADAMVVKNTEPYSIVGGNPARLIKYRFDKRDIDFLCNLKWWTQGETWIQQHAIYFNNIENLRKVVEEEMK